MMTGKSGEALLDLAEQRQPLHPQHIDTRKDGDPLWLNLASKPSPELAKCSTQLAPEAPATGQSDIGLVVSIARMLTLMRGIGALYAGELDRPTMLLRHMS